MDRALFLDHGSLVNLDGRRGSATATDAVLDRVAAPLAWFAARFR